MIASCIVQPTTMGENGVFSVYHNTPAVKNGLSSICGANYSPIMIAHLKRIQFYLPCVSLWEIHIPCFSGRFETSKYLDCWQFVKQMVIAVVEIWKRRFKLMAPECSRYIRRMVDRPKDPPSLTEASLRVHVRNLASCDYPYRPFFVH